MTLSLHKDKIRFLLLEGVHDNALKVLNDAGYTNIEYIKSALDEAELIEKIKDAHFIGIRSRTQLTRKVLESAEKLIAIGCFCIGTNQVDLEAALELGIPVFNAPYSNTRSVAELVLAETIMLMRGVPEKNAVVHRGGWNKSAKDSYEVRGKVMGIVGYGSIGSQLSVLAESLGMKVIYHDAVTKLPLGNAVQVGSLEELLAKADVVTLHVPDLPSTRNMMTAKEFAQMKDCAFFINAARGGCVDIDALAAALESKKILGAAIDVFPKEPKSADEEFESPLRAFDNVILTHMWVAQPKKRRRTSVLRWVRNSFVILIKAIRRVRSISRMSLSHSPKVRTAYCTSIAMSLAYYHKSTHRLLMQASTLPLSH